MDKSILKKINDYIWEIPQNFRSDMRVPGRIFASEKILRDILKDESLEQVVNVATLPGIQKYSYAMPDIHEGYGFPIGGVAAMDINEGVISPGGIGFDINCGVRLLRTEKTFDETRSKIPELTNAIYQEVPSGVGVGGRIKMVNNELDRVLERGAEEMFKKGYVTEEDLKNCESGGRLLEANPDLISKHAKDRGRDQLGTIGAGNHFVEIERVDKIFDKPVAEKLGLFENQICIMVHCGSRGLGHQVATDYIQIMLNSLSKYKIAICDSQLASAPFNSREGQNYFRAMSAAANFAWANRQLITWEVREAWRKIFGSSELKLVYDVAHNIAKIEEYPSTSSGQATKVVVHRKGATRAFPEQPVLIPGSMGTASYVLVGTDESLKQSFGSTCHGAGRVMSRTKAKKIVRGAKLKEEMEEKGIYIKAGSMAGLAEEAPIAYKDIDEVVSVIHEVGLAKKVARLKPVGVIKG
ncbi:MAG: RtcB family protein [Patescibacteria group bacterium]|nr:RtcB family protein [Patescibacteria group bacterium]